MENQRKVIISEFDGIVIDMDYKLNIPSVHAIYEDSEVIVDYQNILRSQVGTFPIDKLNTLMLWITKHKDGIMKNHLRINRGQQVQKIK